MPPSEAVSLRIEWHWISALSHAVGTRPPFGPGILLLGCDFMMVCPFSFFDNFSTHSAMIYKSLHSEHSEGDQTRLEAISSNKILSIRGPSTDEAFFRHFDEDAKLFLSTVHPYAKLPSWTTRELSLPVHLKNSEGRSFLYYAEYFLDAWQGIVLIAGKKGAVYAISYV